MEIIEGNCALFSNSNVLYIHCVDCNVKFEYSFSEAASLSLTTVLRHVSFPSDLRSRRLVLFLCSTEIMDTFKDKRSPVVCRVKENLNWIRLPILAWPSFWDPDTTRNCKGSIIGCCSEKEPSWHGRTKSKNRDNLIAKNSGVSSQTKWDKSLI